MAYVEFQPLEQHANKSLHIALRLANQKVKPYKKTKERLLNVAKQLMRASCEIFKYIDHVVEVPEEYIVVKSKGPEAAEQATPEPESTSNLFSNASNLNQFADLFTMCLGKAVNEGIITINAPIDNPVQEVVNSQVASKPTKSKKAEKGSDLNEEAVSANNNFHVPEPIDFDPPKKKSYKKKSRPEMTEEEKAQSKYKSQVLKLERDIIYETAKRPLTSFKTSEGHQFAIFIRDWYDTMIKDAKDYGRTFSAFMIPDWIRAFGFDYGKALSQVGGQVTWMEDMYKWLEANRAGKYAVPKNIHSIAQLGCPKADDYTREAEVILGEYGPWQVIDVFGKCHEVQGPINYLKAKGIVISDINQKFSKDIWYWKQIDMNSLWHIEANPAFVRQELTETDFLAKAKLDGLAKQFS